MKLCYDSAVPLGSISERLLLCYEEAVDQLPLDGSSSSWSICHSHHICVISTLLRMCSAIIQIINEDVRQDLDPVLGPGLPARLHTTNYHSVVQLFSQLSVCLPACPSSPYINNGMEGMTLMERTYLKNGEQYSSWFLLFIYLLVLVLRPRVIKSRFFKYLPYD